MERWEQMGGAFHQTAKMHFFTMVLAGEVRRVNRCQTKKLALVWPEFFRHWSSDEALYAQYHEALAESPAVSNLTRSGKSWIPYDKIKADDLRVALNAAMDLAARVRKAETE